MRTFERVDSDQLIVEFVRRHTGKNKSNGADCSEVCLALTSSVMNIPMFFLRINLLLKEGVLILTCAESTHDVIDGKRQSIGQRDAIVSQLVKREDLYESYAFVEEGKILTNRQRSFYNKYKSRGIISLYVTEDGLPGDILALFDKERIAQY